MGKELEIITGTTKFLNASGYVGASVLFLAMSYYLYSQRKAASYITGTIGVCLLVIFSGLDIITRFFPTLIVSRTPVLTGRIIGVKQDTVVRLLAGDTLQQRPYIKREFDVNDISLVNYRFIFSLKPSFSCIFVILSSPSYPEPNISYGIPIPKISDLKQNDELLVKVVDKTGGSSGSAEPEWFWMRYEEKNTESKKASALLTNPPTCDAIRTASVVHDVNYSWLNPLKISIIKSAQAQGLSDITKAMPKLNDSQIQDLLQSEDPFVRRAARLGLAADPKSLEIIPKLLKTENYRNKLGAVEAINGMDQNQRASLAPDAWAEVQKLQTSPDATLRGSAQRALSLR